MELVPVIAVILVALVFTYTNGFHDTANTISSGLVEARFVTQEVLICGLVAAICWNLLTWWFGMPSSSSHALIGSLVGAALAGAVCVNAVQPLTDKDGKPVSIWSSVKWKELKDKKEKILAPAKPELIAALGAGIKTNGTHTVQLGSNTVQLLVF